MSRSTVRTPSVEFARKSTPAEVDGNIVRRKGVIFRSGSYPLQRFDMTPSELAEVAKSFRKVPIDHGHPAAGGPLDGAFGELESVELSADGTTLFGVAAFPRWLEEKLGDARRHVSASFDRATKRLRSLSLVTRPQIEDAELLAAFCACHPEALPITPPKARIPVPSQREEDIARLQAMSDDEYAAATAPDENEPDDDDDEPEDTVISVAATPTPSEAAAFARIADLEAKDRRRDAEVFVDAAIRDGLALPAEKARLIARHANFALIEQSLPAEFSDDGKPVRLVAEFEADIRARRPHGLTREGGGPLPANFSGARLLPSSDTPETDREYARRVVAEQAGKQRIIANGTR